MGHSTSSGRSLPRGVEPNSRLGRAWRDAQAGDATVVVREYRERIQKEQARLRSARNDFVRQAALQEIDRLRKEMRRIEEEFLD